MVKTDDINSHYCILWFQEVSQRAEVVLGRWEAEVVVAAQLEEAEEDCQMHLALHPAAAVGQLA